MNERTNERTYISPQHVRTEKENKSKKFPGKQATCKGIESEQSAFPSAVVALEANAVLLPCLREKGWSLELDTQPNFQSNPRTRSRIVEHGKTQKICLP